ECPPLESAQQQSHALQFGNGGAGPQDVAVPALDFFENLQAAAAKQLQIDGQATVDRIGQRKPSKKKFAGNVDRFLHSGAKARIELASEQRFQRISVSFENIERQIHAILFEIDDDVLPEVSQLEGRAGGVGKRLPFGVAISA